MKKQKGLIAALLIALMIGSIAGCGKNDNTVENKTTGALANETSGGQTTSKTLKKVKVGYFGNTCEAPTFAAYEKGFFKEEGLDVELVKGDAGTLKDGLATGKIDVTDGLLNQWLKPMEQGLNIKFTTGIHTGCIQILVPKNSKLKSPKEFKGKTIGVPKIGGGPMILVSRLLSKEGLDSKNDVKWKEFPNAELPIALEKGEVDIISLADPFAQIQVNEGKAISIYDSAVHEPFSHEYCCLVVVNGSLIEKDPETAAAATRAIMKGASWVNSNQKEIAQIMVDKKYVPGDLAVNEKVISTYNYQPSVEGGQDAVINGSKEMKVIGVLDKDTDPEALAKTAFIKLKGVQ
ncbi:MAG: ABC transporter substrate-binding protein [Clostridia bacterium]|nr:ABC transporter substrate-binding protein [Clostridia bacterium]